MIAAGRGALATTGSGSALREHQYDIRLLRQKAESNEVEMASCAPDLLGSLFLRGSRNTGGQGKVDSSGDIRGRQSAALLVVNDNASLPAWGGRVFDLRIEDHPEPIVELRRLLTMARAYNHMNEGDEYFAVGEIEMAVGAYGKAAELVPDNHEVLFWEAVTPATVGRVEDSLPLFRKAFEMWPDWRELVVRLPASDQLPDDPELRRRIPSDE